MLRKIDFRRKKYAPLLDRDLTAALADLFGREFPRLGGERFLRLCATLVLDFLNEHLHQRDTVTHGQVLWLAVNRDVPPARGQRIADAALVPVVLDLLTPDDVHALIERQSSTDRLLARALRLCQQAFEQGGLLGNCDLAVLLNTADSVIARLLVEHERQTGQLVPRRATLHDVGTGLTHKRIICWKRYAEGKTSEQVARETYHSLEAVDRYLGMFDRVRHCRQQNMQSGQIAYILNCSPALVHEYLAIDRELEHQSDPSTSAPS